VGPDTEFQTLLCKLAHTPGRLLHVVDEDGKLQGIISSFDLLHKIVPSYLSSDLAGIMDDEDEMVRRAYEKCRDMTARDLMTTDVMTLSANCLLMEAGALFREHGANAFPVVDDGGRVLGELTRKEVLAHMTTHCLECACEIPR
jgi:CBS-domain-containing membrane protein